MGKEHLADEAVWREPFSTEKFPTDRE